MERLLVQEELARGMAAYRELLYMRLQLVLTLANALRDILIAICLEHVMAVYGQRIEEENKKCT